MMATGKVTAVVAEPDLDVEPQAQTREQAFVWEKQWYPVLPLSYLDTTKPTAVQILGKRLAVWRHSSGWSCFEDSCPHRHAPLSTGKMNSNGTLTCRYHGWSFDKDGGCCNVPMATSEKVSEQARSMQRTCATSYPVQEAGGLLWVWLDSSKQAWEESSQVAPAAVPELAEADWTFQLQPLSYESLVENCMDPSHAPFLHEGLQGQGLSLQSPDKATPILEFDLVGDLTKEGFELEHSPYLKGQSATTKRIFKGPSMCEAVVELPQFTFRAVLYFVPVGPYETRVMFHFPGYEPTLPEWSRHLPTEIQQTWLDIKHAAFVVGDIGYWQFNDQDRIAMEGQDRTRFRAPRPQAVDLALTPSDRGVAVFQRWLRSQAGGGPFGLDGQARGPVPLGPAPAGPEDAPRWRLHCAHCPKCRRAMLLCEQASIVCGQAAAVTLVSSGIVACLGMPSIGVAAGAAALSLRWVSETAAEWRSLFFRADSVNRTEDVYMV